MLHFAKTTCRSLVRAPRFSIAVAASLTLGLTAATTSSRILELLLARTPDGVRSGDRLVRMYFDYSGSAPAAGNPGMTSAPVVGELESDSSILSGVAAFFERPVSSGAGRYARELHATFVSSGYFPTLGVDPLRGSLAAFRQPSEQGARVVAISAAIWRGAFQGREDIIGQTLRIGGRPYTIAAVLPTQFAGTELTRGDVWLPLGAIVELRGEQSFLTNRSHRWLNVIGRLPPGVSLSHATTRLNQELGDRGTAPTSGTSSFISLTPLPRMWGPDRTRERGASVAVGALSLLLLMCAYANTVSLMLTRVLGRRENFALHIALGAPPRIVLTTALGELAVLVLASSLLALLLSQLVTTPVLRLLGLSAPPSAAVWMLSASMLLGALTLAATGLLLVLGLRARRHHLLRAAPVADARSPLDLTQRGLLVVQTAAAFCLAAMAIELRQGFDRSMQLDLGIARESLWVATIDTDGPGWSETRTGQAFDALRLSTNTVPQVRTTSLASTRPFGNRFAFLVRGSRGDEAVPALHFFADDAYHATARPRLVTGRWFTAAETGANAAPVVVVNQALARAIHPNASAVGSCLRYVDDPPGRCIAIIGIVTTGRYGSLSEPPAPALYRPLTRASQIDALYLRTSGPISAAALQQKLQGADPGLPYVRLRAASDFLDEKLRYSSLALRFFTVYSAIALVICAVGLGSVVRLLTQTQEYAHGIMLALGCPPWRVVALVFRQLLVVVGGGFLLGLAMLRFGERFGAGFDLQLAERATSLAAALVLGTAILAVVAPSLRVLRLDPSRVMRGDTSTDASKPRTKGMMTSRRSVIVVLTASWCVACFHRGALPIDAPWPQPVPAFVPCSKVHVAGRPRTEVFDAFRRAAQRERIPLFVDDTNDLRLVIAGPAAPAFRGNGALRRSRVYLELVTEPDSVAEGAGRFTLAEGASIVGQHATARDSAAMQVQASRLSRRLAQRAGYPTGGGCWSG